MTMRDREIREEELLAHLGWVQGLALRLVHDATGAEDVAQEAFVHALAHPPRTRTGPALGAFLATLTRRLAWNTRRADERRRRRETLAAVPEATPSTLDVVERNALVQRISEAVMALDEPYRSTVLYRYLDGHDAGRIAERMGVSREAVRKRLSRALAELRTRLEREWGGSSGSWALALLPPAWGQGALMTKKAVAAGGILMVGKVQVVAGIALFAGAATVGHDVLRNESVELEPLTARQAASVGEDDRTPRLEPTGAERPDRVTDPGPTEGAGNARSRRSNRTGAQGAPDLGSMEEAALRQRRVAIDLQRLQELYDRAAIEEAGAVGLLVIDSARRAATAKRPPDGLHTLRLEDGEPSAQGMMFQGERSGAWTEWHPGGKVAAQGEYFDGDRHGWWTFWREGGKESSEGEFLYGRKEGVWNEFHADGSVSRVSTLRNGKRTGVERAWHEGVKQLASEIEHYADSPDGKAKTWYADGTLESAGYHAMGQKVGLWKYWNSDGTLDEERSGEVD